MVRCRHAVTKIVSVNQFGGDPIMESITNCRVKQQGSLGRVEVYQHLFDKGLENSLITNACPLAESGEWGKCAFYEPE